MSLSNEEVIEHLRQTHPREVPSDYSLYNCNRRVNVWAVHEQNRKSGVLGFDALFLVWKTKTGKITSHCGALSNLGQEYNIISVVEKNKAVYVTYTYYNPREDKEKWWAFKIPLAEMQEEAEKE